MYRSVAEGSAPWCDCWGGAGRGYYEKEKKERKKVNELFPSFSSLSRSCKAFSYVIRLVVYSFVVVDAVVLFVYFRLVFFQS